MSTPVYHGMARIPRMPAYYARYTIRDHFIIIGINYNEQYHGTIDVSDDDTVADSSMIAQLTSDAYEKLNASRSKAGRPPITIAGITAKAIDAVPELATHDMEWIAYLKTLYARRLELNTKITNLSYSIRDMSGDAQLRAVREKADTEAEYGRIQLLPNDPRRPSHIRM